MNLSILSGDNWTFIIIILSVLGTVFTGICISSVVDVIKIASTNYLENTKAERDQISRELHDTREGFRALSTDLLTLCPEMKSVAIDEEALMHRYISYTEQGLAVPLPKVLVKEVEKHEH